MTEEMKNLIKTHAKFRYSEEFFKNHEEYQIVFYEGAKFILEMPELREAIRLVKSFYTEGDDTYCTCGVELGSDNSWKDPECLYHEAKANFESLKKAGLDE